MNFIQKYNINKHLTCFEKRKKTKGIQVCSWEQAENICLLYTFEAPQSLEELMKLISLLRKKKNNITLYCCIPKKENTLSDNSADTCFISEKDSRFNGILRKEKRVVLQKQSFDILIHLDKEPTLLSLYLSSEIKAKFRIGRSESTRKYNNLTLYSSNENDDFETFFQSIEQYTRKIIK